MTTCPMCGGHFDEWEAVHLPDTLEPVPAAEEPAVSLESGTPVPGSTFDASTLPEKQWEQFHRNLRAVEQVLAGAPQTRIAGR
jgi:hypothetical protein